MLGDGGESFFWPVSRWNESPHRLRTMTICIAKGRQSPRRGLKLDFLDLLKRFQVMTDENIVILRISNSEISENRYARKISSRYWLDRHGQKILNVRDRISTPSSHFGSTVRVCDGSNEFLNSVWVIWIGPSRSSANSPGNSKGLKF
jgi:hypothetical protein